MDKLTILKYAVLLLFLFLSYQAVEAHDKNYKEDGTYISQKRDVTGDKVIDVIQVEGIPNEKGGAYLREIQLNVESKRQDVTVSLQAGYKPHLYLTDLNKDGVQDVLVTVLNGGKDRTLTTFAYSFKNGKAVELETPPSVPVMAQFLDGYKAEVGIEGQKSMVIDVSEHKEKYEELGIYQNGRLNESMELQVGAYTSLKPKTFFGKRRGLSGIQYVKGADETDRLIEIQSLWKFNNGWTLVKAKMKPVNIAK